MNTKFQVKVRAMSETEVMDMVPSRVLASIKAENHKPIFKAFVVGQEGEAKPRLVGIGPVVQRWFKSAIQALAVKLRIGTPVFNLHAPTNEHTGRTSIGEVVGKAVHKIGDKASAVFAAYIYPEYQDLVLDVASVEADLMVPAGSRDQEIEDEDILDVTGIALGNSAINKPAFPGATLLATLQAFAEKPHQGDTHMTPDEIRIAIREGKLKPSDVFDLASLTSDPYVKEHVEEKINNAKGYDIRKRQDLETKVTTLEAEKKTLQDELASSKTSVLKTKADTTLETVLKTRPKLAGDEKFVKFLKKTYAKDFKPGEEAALERDINKFIDTQVDDYKEIVGEPGKDGKGEAGGSGAGGVGEGEGTQAGNDDMTDPKKNDLIPS